VTAALGHPAWAPALLAAPLAALALLALDRLRARRLAAALGPRAPALSPEVGEGRRALRRGLFALGLLLAILAALRPAFGAPVPEVAPRGADVVLCLDVSRSMLAQDVAPDRLSAAKREAKALAARAVGDRLALVLYAGEARPFVALTHDAAAFAELVDLADPLEVLRGGSDLGAALEVVEALLASGRSERATVVVLSDGEDRGGRAVDAARRLAARGVPVHAIGFGTALGGKVVVETEAGPAFLRDAAGNEVVTALDAAALARVAEAGGGTYADAGPSEGALVSLYERRVLPLERTWAAAEGLRRREDRYQWPLLAAFLLLLADLGLGDRRRRRR
jgi:Ca-activated chloride channel family protein